MLQHILRRGVEEIERLIEDHQFRGHKQGGDNTHLLFVTGREVTDEFLLSEDLAASQTLVCFQTLFNFRLRDIVYLTQEGKELLGGQEIHEEGLVNIGTSMVFPVLALSRVDVVDAHTAFVGF